MASSEEKEDSDSDFSADFEKKMRERNPDRYQPVATKSEEEPQMAIKEQEVFEQELPEQTPEEAARLAA